MFEFCIWFFINIMESSDGLGSLKNQESPISIWTKIGHFGKIRKKEKNRQSRRPQKRGSRLKIWLHCVARQHSSHRVRGGSPKCINGKMCLKRVSTALLIVRASFEAWLLMPNLVVVVKFNGVVSVDAFALTIGVEKQQQFSSVVNFS